MSQEFRHMFSPIEVGPVTMRNRLYFGGHDTNFGPPNSAPKDRAIDYYVARAKGGVAAVITPNLVGTVSTGAPIPADTITDERSVPDLKKCADAIHRHGSKVLAQLCMVGRMGQTRPFGGITWSASPVRLDLAPFEREIPHEMETEEIKQAITSFGLAAKNVRAAGYDGIEILGAGGLLLHQFLSPALNHRRDQFGGSLENRLQFPLEIIDAVREAIGANMVLGFKMPGDDFFDGGILLDEAKRIAIHFEETGKLDYLTVVGGMYISVPTHVPPMYYPLGCFVYLASEIRRAVRKINVNCMGRINDPTQAESIIADGHADMIGMVRALICDPEFPNKAREGRIDEIRQCVGCEEGCYGRFRRGLPITCAYNPEAGREREFSIVPTTNRKRLMVIGGGIAGLETARVAALRGHQVSLYERETELGGQVCIAAKTPRRDDFEQMPRYYSYQMNLLGVEVHLGTEVTAEMVAEREPDAVVVATGSVPLELDVPGAQQKNVVEPRSVLQGRVEVGQNVVVVAGEHNMEALSTADFLAERGKKVQIITEFFYAGAEAPFGIVQAVYARLCSKGITIMTLTAVKEIQGSTVTIRNVFSDVESRIEGVDTVVAAMGGKPDDALYHLLKGKVKELHRVGDCIQPRLIPQIALDGAQIGRIL